jgi:microcystin-dependent protein
MDGTAAVGTGTTWARADHVHPSDTTKANLASPTFTGVPAAPTPVSTDSSATLATTAFVKAQGYVTSSGVTSVTGTAPVVSSGGNTPAISMAAATGSVPGYLTAADWTTFNAKAPTASPTFTGVPVAPTAATADSSTTIATTAFVKAQNYLTAVPATYAPLASPVFSGDPQAPTPSTADNDTSIATTAFVKNQGYATTASVPVAAITAPLMDGVAAVGTGTSWARSDHVHPSDTTKLGDAPSDGNTYGRKNGAWVIAAGGVLISDTAPSSGVQAGQLWWESDTGNLFTYYTDVDSSQWVMVASATMTGGSTPSSGRVPGEIATFAMSTAPTGWLECDGALISRTLYPALFTAIGTTYGAGDGSTTFGKPDFRGEFLRGWDDGRGVDSGRTIGSAQAQALISHTHTQQGSFTTGYVSVDHSHTQAGTWASGGRSAAHSHSQSDNLSGNLAANWGCYTGGGFTNEVMIGRAGGLQTGTESADHSHNTGIGGQTGGISANHTHSVTISGATTAAGGTETRPRNVAVMYCIKY